MSADIQNLVQRWADNQAGLSGMAVRASNEADVTYWKRFSSAQGGEVPHIEVSYNSRPDPATGLTVSDRGDNGGVTYTRSATPTLSYRVGDPDGDGVAAHFYVYDGDTMIADQAVGVVPSGAVATWTVPAGVLQPGRTYRFRASGHDYYDWAGDGFYSIKSKLSGRALDIADCSRSAGANVQIANYWAGGCQRWYLTQRGGGFYSIVGRDSGNAADVDNCGTANGTNVKVWTNNGNDCQQFALDVVGNGDYKVRSKSAGRVLDVAGCSAEHGANVWIWDYVGADCQKWRIDPAPDAGITVQWLQFTVDTTAPGAPFVSSTDYPNDGTWNRGAGQAGVFTFNPPPATPDVAACVWGLDATPATEVAAGAGGVATASVLAIVTWIERTYHRRRRQTALGRLTPIEFDIITIQTADQAA